MVSERHKESPGHIGIRGKAKSLWTYLAAPEKPNPPSKPSEEALRRLILLLLEAIECYAIPGDDIDYEQYRADIRNIIAQFTADILADDALIIAGQVCTILKGYFERTNRFIASRKDEYQKMVSMFTETISSLNTSGERSIVRLKDIEKQIEGATIIEDIRTHRLRLGQCLETIREEIHTQETVSADIRNLLEKGIGSSNIIANSNAVEPSMGVAQEPMLDTVTGLPTQKEAEAALLEVLGINRTYFVVPILAKGVHAIYSRLGSEVGDGVLCQISEQLRSLLDKEDRIFRWGGPVFMAILQRSTTITEVRRELYGLSRVRLDDSIQIGARLLWLPVSASWEVIAAIPPLYSLVLKIDQFVAAHAPGSVE